MKKQCILVGMLAASLSASDAMAQHQTPKEQPPQTIDASAPAGDLSTRHREAAQGVTADGKPLPAGTYQVS